MAGTSQVAAMMTRTRLGVRQLRYMAACLTLQYLKAEGAARRGGTLSPVYGDAKDGVDGGEAYDVVDGQPQVAEEGPEGPALVVQEEVRVDGDALESDELETIFFPRPRALIPVLEG